MNRYQAPLPRTVISIAAVAMATLTLGLSVLPAKLNSGGYAAPHVDTSFAFGPATGAASGEGMPIVVYGVREQDTALQKVRDGLPLRKEQG